MAYIIIEQWLRYESGFTCILNGNFRQYFAEHECLKYMYVYVLLLTNIW